VGQLPIELILVRQLANGLAVPTFVVDAAGDLVFVNEAAETLLGLDFEDVGQVSFADWTTAFASRTKGRQRADPATSRWIHRARSCTIALAIVLVVSACSGLPVTSPTLSTAQSTVVPTGSPPEPATSSEGPATTSVVIDLSTLTGRIVFDNNDDVWIMNADGTDLKRLTESPWHEFQPALSPDGRLIAYRSEPHDSPELWLMNADGSGQHQLTPDGGFPAWSPDGATIAYAPGGGPSGKSSIAIINPDGSGQRRLPGTDYGEHPSWSPDGKRIAFSNNLAGTARMSIVDVDGSRVVDLSSAGEGGKVAWSPDGLSILFISHRDRQGNTADVYVMRPDGSGVTRLTRAGGEMPAWSPDGRHIVYAYGRLFVMQADGSGVTSLPVGEAGEASFPNWR
jgi:dipeptidyl aminopeptidase/acylaminoacyl peptidase